MTSRTGATCPSGAGGHRAKGPTAAAAAAAVALRTDPTRSDYLYLGASLSRATVTPNHILALEKPGHHGNGGMHIVFGDHSVQWVPAHRATYIVAELSAGRNPPRIPPP